MGRRGALRASLRTRATAAVSSQIYDVKEFKPIHMLYRSDTLAFRARITAPSSSSKTPFLDRLYLPRPPATTVGRVGGR